jgi:hypothetical protein
MRVARFLTITAFALAMIALPGAASAVDFSIFGSYWDTDDLGEAIGGGLRVGFPINDNIDFDISAAYFEDWTDQVRSIIGTGAETDIELSTIPIDAGFTWTRLPEGGFLFGAGLTYGYMDVNDLAISGTNLRATADANDEFGGYVKAGYQAQGGFLAEVMYRFLEASVEDIRIPGTVLLDDSIDVKLDGYQVNLGWRF